MKTLILIIKGILLWTTVLTTALFIAGIDGIIDKGYFFYGIIIVATLIFTCYKTITEDELMLLAGVKSVKL